MTGAQDAPAFPRADGAEGFHTFKACLSEIADRTVDLHVASIGGESSSYLPPAAHIALAPSVTFDRTETMVTETLDPASFDYIGLDTQGSGMDILRGGTETLRGARYVCTEINFGNLYQGDTGLYDTIGLMRGWGFDLYQLSMKGQGWGDALFIRREAARFAQQAGTA